MILAIESSSKVSSVAVADDDKIFSEISSQTKFTHSEALLVNIQLMNDVLDLLTR